jgi:dTDP-4-amino-4,6-dideoxygalactose transaminase
MPHWLATRRRYATLLSRHLLDVPGLRITLPCSDIEHSYYKYYVIVVPEVLRAGWNRDRIMQQIAANGIPCFSGSCSEIYLEKAFDTDMRPQRCLEIARELGETSLMFLVHPTLTEQNILDTVDAVKRTMSEAAL